MLLVETLEGQHGPFALAVIDCAKATTATVENVMNSAFCVDMNYRDSAKGIVSEPHFQINEFVIFGMPNNLDEELAGKLPRLV